MPTIFITGANRGIGLEFVKQYAQQGYTVFASYLPTAETEELQQLAEAHANISLIPMDVTQEDQIIAAAQKLKNETIDILINNAGIFGGSQDLEKITADTMINVFKVNTIGPLLVIKHFINHVAASTLKTIVAITSRQGSISAMLKKNQVPSDAYAYRASKAALNIIMSGVALDTHARGIRVLLFHPGHVKTAMGGPDAEIDVHTSVSGMIKIITQAPRSLENFFYMYDGTKLSW